MCTVDKLFPLSDKTGRVVKRIRWGLAQKIYACYSDLYGTDQSLSKIAERGGFYIEEIPLIFGRWNQKHILENTRGV